MTNTTIPKKIHQIFIHCDGDDGDDFNTSPTQIEWQRHHPTWEYKRWTRKSCRDLMVANYSAALMQLYDAFPYDEQRVDTARFAILDQHGGICVDEGLYPTCPIDGFVAGSEEAFFLDGSNSIMAGVAGASIWKLALRRIYAPPSLRLSLFAKITRGALIAETTGHVMVRNLLESSCEIGTVGRFPRARMLVSSSSRAPPATVVVITATPEAVNAETWRKLKYIAMVILKVVVALIIIHIVLSLIFGYYVNRAVVARSAASVPRWKRAVVVAVKK